MYKLTTDGLMIQRLLDNVFIPLAEGNADYQAYLAWVEEGGVPTPADE